MNRKVYVANLPYQATDSEIKDCFSKVGNVMSVKIVQDRQTGQPRGILPLWRCLPNGKAGELYPC